MELDDTLYDLQRTPDINEYIFQPQAMLLMYKSNTGRSPFLEIRDIDADGVPGEGRPVTKQFINDLLEGFSTEVNEMPNGPVPDNLLYADTRPGNFKLIWYNPPRKRHLCFVKDLNMEDGDYMMPGTIYATEGYDRLYIYAFKGKSRPTETTKLYNMPIYNYYSHDHHLCLGSSKIDMSTIRKRAGLNESDNLTYDAILKAWESLVWDSVNSHLGSDDTVNGILSNVLKENRDRPSFNTDSLVKTIYTLKSLYNGK